MRMINFKNFSATDSVNENVQQAKIFLKKRFLAAKKSKTGKEDETLTPEEQRRAETNPEFLKIKEMLRDNPGYVYAFTKFFFEEEVPFEELKAMYAKIKKNRAVINTLPMRVEEYADIEATSSDQRKGFERLGDDMTKLEEKRIVKKFVDRLPGDFTVTIPAAKDKGTVVASIKRAYQNSSAAIKEKVHGIALAFDEFGKSPDGSKDEKKNKELQDMFFDKVKRYRNLNEVIQAALSFIKSANNGNISKFLQTIQNVNKKYGELNGAEVVYDEEGVLIIEVKSYHANKELNSNTSHCIASSSYQWDNYVGSDSNFNKQYYIYNFNLQPNDNKSVIGITIQPRGEIRACHLKNDAGFSDGIKSYLRNLGIEWSVLAPMTPEEIERKKKRVIANKEIIKPNLSLSKVEQYIEEGADPNAQQGKPLINSVNEDDYEKTKYLLEVGAAPNIGNAIKGAKNLKMIQLLVTYGATITNEIFNSIADDYDGVKYLIDAGMDVNFEDGMPLRIAAKAGNINVMKLLLDNGAEISQRRYMVVKWASEWGRLDILKFLLSKLKEKNDFPPKRTMDDWVYWATTSDKIEDDKIRKEVEAALKAGLVNAK